MGLVDGDNVKCQRKIIINLFPLQHVVTIIFDCHLGQSNEETSQAATQGTNLQWMLRHH